MDVHNAFLHVDLQVEVYICMPLGLYAHKPRMICHLKKVFIWATTGSSMLV